MASAEQTEPLVASQHRPAPAETKRAHPKAPPRVAIVLRPRSAAALTELALRFVVDLAPRLQIALALFVLLPGFVLTAATRYVFELPWIWVWALAFGYGCAARGVFICACHHILVARRPSVLAVITAWRPHAFADWANGFVFALSRTLAAISLFGSPAARRWSLTREVALMEHHLPIPLTESLRRAARRSWSLTSPGGPPVGRVALLEVALALGCIGSSEILGRGVLEQLLMLGPSSLPEELPAAGVFALLGYFLSIPFTTAARFLAYVDGRTRRCDWETTPRAERRP